eukprot:513264-Hanusia_phi.AAC.1
MYGEVATAELASLTRLTSSKDSTSQLGPASLLCQKPCMLPSSRTAGRCMLAPVWGDKSFFRVQPLGSADISAPKRCVR